MPVNNIYSNVSVHLMQKLSRESVGSDKHICNYVV